MTRRSFHPLSIALLVLLPVSCATVDPEPHYERAGAEVEEATGESSLYQPGNDASAREQVEALLLDGLTAREAVQIALLNNHELRADLFEIGMAHADAVQAGLLSNPSLDALVRFPSGDGHTNTEAGLFQNLIELWHIPARERFAESHLERTVLKIAHKAATLAAECKAAYYSGVAAREGESVASENLGMARTFLELTVERRDAGAANQVDVNAARSELLEQELAARSAEYSTLEAKGQLALILGLARAPQEIELTERLPDLPPGNFELDTLLEIAGKCRLDLRAAIYGVEAAENELELERRSLFGSAGVGVAFETEGSDRSIGPAVSLQIPLFDQGQARIAKARFRLEQARRVLEELSTQATVEVRRAHARYSFARDSVRLYQEELLPLRRSSLDLAREAFAGGKTSFLAVLEAQNRLLDARREYVVQLEGLAVAVPEFESACGRPMAALMQSAASAEVSR